MTRLKELNRGFERVYYVYLYYYNDTHLRWEKYPGEGIEEGEGTTKTKRLHGQS